MIHYTEKGKGFPVVLIHGFCETHEVWSELIPILADEYRVIALDLPGFGGSDALARPFTLDDAAQAVVTFIQELNLATCIVLGHSLGGYVVLAMAERNPKLFAGFGLIHSTAFADSEERKISRGKVIEFVEEHGVKPFVQSFIPPLFFNQAHPAVAPTVVLAEKTPLKTLTGYTEAMRGRPDRTRVLCEYSNPILFLAGEKDSIIPVQSLEEQAGLAAKPTLVVLHNAAHMGMLENIPETAAAIRMFVQRVAV
ncbi:MAG: alpha/beta hydrolase [Cyclobacteriaceae bacterium]|nr:alpha/beta hydrolase [Cyclobacteriaceae bacterium]